MYYIVYEPKTYYYVTTNGDIITALSGYYITGFPAPNDNIIDIVFEDDE
jgi:hypothetical protein